MKSKTLIQRIQTALVTYHGMDSASVVTQAFAYYIFGTYCTTLVNCDTDAELGKAITAKMVSQAASGIISKALPYFDGRVEMTAN